MVRAAGKAALQPGQSQKILSSILLLHEDYNLDHVFMFAGLGSKHVPSTARRVGKIESNLDDRVDVITPKV